MAAVATFFTDLMNSIFVPGPTQSLIVATNASFACLQVVLLVLLIATYSIHFLILSFLCGGLWWSINWFVAELGIAREAEEKKKKEEQQQRALDSESDTEAETIIETTRSGSKEVEPVEKVGSLKDRARAVSAGQGSRSEQSTEDEWEKISENENEKDK